MGRPPLPIGDFGKITKTQTGADYKASCRFRDLDGITRQVTATGPTAQKAENALKRKLKNRAAPGGQITPDMKLADLADAWFATVTESDGTKDTYRRNIDRHLKPLLGGVRIRELTTGRADAYLTAVRTPRTAEYTTPKGKTRQTLVGGPSAALTARSVLSLMMGLAVRHDAAEYNPVRETTPPPAATTKARALTLEEYKRLRANILAWQTSGTMGPRKSPLIDKVDILLATGLRPGELLALRWQDIDLHKGTATSSGTIRYTSVKGLHRQPKPKTEHSERTLLLPAFAVKTLARIKLSQAPGSNPGGLVFPSRAGGPIDPGNFRRQWTAARGEEFAWVKPSSLRKTVATLIDREAGSVTAAAQLGHGGDAVTRKHYIERNLLAPDSTAVLEAFQEGAG